MWIVLDWIINKPIRIKNLPGNLKPGEKIVYKYSTENKIEENIWIVLWYNCNSEKEGKFVDVLKWKLLKRFSQLNEKANSLFKIFKKDFNKFFKEAVPITARFTWNWKKIYFYFYSEDRLDFRDFLRMFKPKIKIPFFLYQVWARDWIRLDPRSEGCYWCCGERILCCVSYKCPLPSVETDLIKLENLLHRWIDKLRWRCWKLKCCLNYEKHIYEEEWKKYPEIGQKFKSGNKIYTCQVFNIMTWNIIAKDEEGFTKEININEVDEIL